MKDITLKEHLKRIASKGGKALVKKYGKKQLQAWGKLGGYHTHKRKR